jgi:hypothetical protein
VSPQAKFLPQPKLGLGEFPPKLYVIDCVILKQGFGPSFPAILQPISSELRVRMASAKWPEKSLITARGGVKRQSGFGL